MALIGLLVSVRENGGEPDEINGCDESPLRMLPGSHCLGTNYSPTSAFNLGLVKQDQLALVHCPHPLLGRTPSTGIVTIKYVHDRNSMARGAMLGNSHSVGFYPSLNRCQLISPHPPDVLPALPHSSLSRATNRGHHHRLEWLAGTTALLLRVTSSASRTRVWTLMTVMPVITLAICPAARSLTPPAPARLSRYATDPPGRSR